MKMLSKERTYINFSLDMVLYLLKGQARHSIKLFHYQICNKLDSYHAIYPVSVPQSHPMYLKIMLQPSPKLLYGVMLLPDRDCFACSQFPSENHKAFDLRTIQKENQYHFSKRWTFCFLSGYWYTFASPCRIIQLYLKLLQRKLLFLAFYSENIVALCMNYYLVKTFFCKYVYKVISAPLSREYIRTIPTIEGNRESVQVNTFLFIQFQHRMEHLSEYIWLRCVTTTLFTHRSDTKWDDSLTYLDGYGNDVLTLYNMMMLTTIPAIGETNEFTKPIYDSIVNTEGNSHSGKSCWTFCKCIFYQLFCFWESSEEKQFPKMVNTPGVDSIIDFVFINVESLNELVRSEYVKHMPISQHQENLAGEPR